MLPRSIKELKTKSDISYSVQDIIIRRYNPDNKEHVTAYRDLVLDMASQLEKVALGFYLQAGLQLSEPMRKPLTYEEFLHDAESIYLFQLIQTSGTTDIIGYCKGGLSTYFVNCWGLQEFFIRPSYRKRGYGTLALTGLKKIISSAKVAYMQVMLSVHNTAAVKTYTDNGFKSYSQTLLTKL